MFAIKVISRAVLAASLGACATSLPVPEALDYRSISAVEAEIKHEIGLYLVAAARLPPTITDVNGRAFTLPTDPLAYSCGGGDIRFDINSVKADLLVTDENIGTLGGGITAPTQVGSVGFTGKTSKDTTNTQELVYSVWFDPLSKQDPNQSFLKQVVTYDSLKSAPIALALINLRDSLVASGLKDDPYTHTARAPLPCHWNWNIDPVKPGGDPGNSIKFAITVLKDTSGGANISIYIVSLNASDEYKTTRANTLTVSFYQHDTLDVTPAAKPKTPTNPKKLKRISEISVSPLTQLAYNEWSNWGRVVSDVSLTGIVLAAGTDIRGQTDIGLDGGTACPIQIAPRCTVGDSRYECIRCDIPGIPNGGGGGSGGRSRGGNGLDSVPPVLK